MERLKHKIIIIVVIAAIALLGPFLTSPELGNSGWFNVPKSYLFILIVWALFIMVYGVIITKSKW